MFADDITRRVIGADDVLASVSPLSPWGRVLAATPRFFERSENEAWQEEQNALAAVDAWWSDDRADCREAFAQLPTLERPLLVLDADGVLDDVALFELKRFLFHTAVLVRASAGAIEDVAGGWAAFATQRMHEIHPEAQPSPRFTLVASLSPELVEARRRVKAAREADRQLRAELEAAVAAEHDGSFNVAGRFVAGEGRIADERLRPLGDGTYELTDTRLDELAATLQVASAACQRTEHDVRAALSDGLRPHIVQMRRMRDALGELDRRCALVELRRQWGGCWPTWGKHMRIDAGTHPRLLGTVAVHELQAISIELDHRPAVVTGPNMGGKSMLLELVGLVQWCAQHGFPVPAIQASFAPVNRVTYVGSEDPSIGEGGLSSFGREVRRVVEQSGAQSPVLWLLDEFGRGTHPDDGSQLALELVQARVAAGDAVLAATHFPTLAAMADAAHFRIAGLSHPEVLSALGADPSLDAIESALRAAMDYRPLVRAPDDAAVPRDARLVASALGLDLP